MQEKSPHEFALIFQANLPWTLIVYLYFITAGCCRAHGQSVSTMGIHPNSDRRACVRDNLNPTPSWVESKGGLFCGFAVARGILYAYGHRRRFTSSRCVRIATDRVGGSRVLCWYRRRTMVQMDDGLASPIHTVPEKRKEKKNTEYF